MLLGYIFGVLACVEALAFAAAVEDHRLLKREQWIAFHLFWTIVLTGGAIVAVLWG